MAPSTTLTDLPPELLDHITAYLPTAQSVSNLGRTSKTLHTFVEKDAWQTFNRTRFPSLSPHLPISHHKDAAQSLTTLSRAWDRRAFIARYTEPQGDIRAFPGDKKVDRWKRPRGQTIGFTPQLDCFEEIGSSWRERTEVLAFSAGAEICIRKRKTGSKKPDVSWLTYRPLSSVEGKDDVTGLHLLRPQEGEETKELEVVTGTANGDLQLLAFSGDTGTDVAKTHFTTQGLPVRSTSISQQPFQPPLLAANLGDTRISLYRVDSTHPKITPSSQLDIRPPTTNGGHRSSHRAWSTNFLSPSNLAVGLGPSEEPIHIYDLTPSGLSKDAVRKFSLQRALETGSNSHQKSTSSVYPIVPVPSSSAGFGEGQVFLSGAYDGVIRLHDLRSKQEVEVEYTDPTDDSAIYSLLPRGRETLVAGTSRHSLLKVFDLRLRAKCYSYLDAYQDQEGRKDWNLFLKPHSATYSGRGGGNNWARRSQESSIYSLTSPSHHSPYIYAGVENAVVEMAFMGVLDRYTDPVLGAVNAGQGVNHQHSVNNQDKGKVGGTAAAAKVKIPVDVRPKEILDLAMYEQSAQDMKLMTQRSLWETQWVVQNQPQSFLEGWDERWKVGGS